MLLKPFASQRNTPTISSFLAKTLLARSLNSFTASLKRRFAKAQRRSIFLIPSDTQFRPSSALLFVICEGYFRNKDRNETVIFDAFYRNNPMDSGYSICAGLEQVIDYINNLHFEDDDIAYLRSLGIFGEDFLDYLRDFHFSGDIYAIPEGSIMFSMFTPPCQSHTRSIGYSFFYEVVEIAGLEPTTLCLQSRCSPN